MNTDPIVKEILIKGTPAQVWRAITDPEEMKNWYFDLPGFKAEAGYQFEFWGGPEDRRYLHKCEIKQAIPNQKLSYSWRYEGYPGDSLVTFEIIPCGNETLVRLTHEGLHTFPEENPDLAKKNFDGGWEAIIRDSLRNHVEHHS